MEQSNCYSRPYIFAVGVHWFGPALGIRPLIRMKTILRSNKRWVDREDSSCDCRNVGKFLFLYVANARKLIQLMVTVTRIFLLRRKHNNLVLILPSLLHWSVYKLYKNARFELLCYNTVTNLEVTQPDIRCFLYYIPWFIGYWTTVIKPVDISVYNSGCYQHHYWIWWIKPMERTICGHV